MNHYYLTPTPKKEAKERKQKKEAEENWKPEIIITTDPLKLSLRPGAWASSSSTRQDGGQDMEKNIAGEKT